MLRVIISINTPLGKDNTDIRLLEISFIKVDFTLIIFYKFRKRYYIDISLKNPKAIP